jgi:hypothetical protein
MGNSKVQGRTERDTNQRSNGVDQAEDTTGWALFSDDHSGTDNGNEERDHHANGRGIH